MAKTGKSQSISRTRRSSSSTEEVETVQLFDRQWVKSGEYTHQECCGCGLVHRVKFKLVDGELWEQWIEDAKLTRLARARRNKDGDKGQRR